MDLFTESKRNFTYSKFEYRAGQSEIEIVDEKDPVELKKLLLRKESEWRKERALQQQRLELCELEINEGKIREQNLRKMNETIMATLNDLTNEDNKNKAMKDLLQKLEEHSSSIINQKGKTTEIIRNLEVQNKSLKDKLSEWEAKVRDVELHYEKTVMSQDHRIKELDKEIQRLNINAAKIEEEKKILRKSLDLEKKLKSEESHSIVEHLKRSHEEELENVRRESDRAVAELKGIYEQDKSTLESRLEKTLIMMRNYQNIIERQGQVNQAQSASRVEAFEERNIELDRYEEELRKEYDDILSRVKERERLEKRREESPKKQTRFDEMRENGRPSDFGRSAPREEEKDSSAELRKYVEKLEESQQKLRNLVLEKEQLLEEEKMKSLRAQQQQQQQRQAPSQQQNFNKYDSFQRGQAFSTPSKIEAKANPMRVFSESDVYYKMSRNQGAEDLDRQETEEREEKRGVSLRKQHEAQRNPGNYDDSFREAYPFPYKEYLERSSERNKRFDFTDRESGLNSRSELSTMIRCENCKMRFQPPEFMSHLMSCDSRPSLDSDSKNERVLTTQIKRGKYKADLSEEHARNDEYFQQHYSEEIYKIVMSLKREKGDIERRLREVESRLKLSENRNESLENEKEHLREDLERIGDEMRGMKINSIFFEEKKEGYESTLKNEIKYLIGKLLKAKHKLVNQGQSSNNNSMLASNNAVSELGKNSISMSSQSRVLNFSPASDPFPGHKRSGNYQPEYEDDGYQNWREVREVTVSSKQTQSNKGEAGFKPKTPLKERGERELDFGMRRNFEDEEEEYRYLTEKKQLHGAGDSQYYDEEEEPARSNTTSGKIRNYRNILSSKIKMKNY